MEFSSPRRGKFYATNFEEKAQVEAAPAAASPDDSSDASNLCRLVEKEAMFEKVVTPSDVGKLNRLVIPKQHAEKYFPLDELSIPTDEKGKGRLLAFEDRCGTTWRFRYSYWRSSQSYVITKGWSRFVKDKRLHAGDTVCFARGLYADSGRQYRFYIDWKHQPPKQYAVNDFTRGFSSSQQPLAVPWVWQRLAFGSSSPSNLSGGGRQLMCFRLPLAPSMPPPNCVPGRNGAAAIKRVRLFGVNLDCAGTAGPGCPSASATTTHLQCQAPPVNTLQLLQPPRAVEETALASSASSWWSSPISKEQRPPLEYLYP